jgi:hypothetical protein
MEAEIQARAPKKDRRFIFLFRIFRFLFLREQFQYVGKKRGFRIYSVDGEWVKNNLSVVFEHGGHGYVHEFIPLDEVWVATYHPVGCVCKNVRADRKMSRWYSAETSDHEIDEFNDMARGIIFETAHQNALQKEIARGVLDPYAENYSAVDS